ncbi:MAG: hypothetical protein ACD_58C00200G0004 [uncultured bacterium]|nr:MAG: hypothetical protein ACD_58C00200G0004 [uncultured bacterium]
MEWKNLLLILAILACPLMHLLMMRGMHKKDHQMNNDDKDDKNQQNKSCH